MNFHIYGRNTEFAFLSCQNSLLLTGFQKSAVGNGGQYVVRQKQMAIAIGSGVITKVQRQTTDRGDLNLNMLAVNFTEDRKHGAVHGNWGLLSGLQFLGILFISPPLQRGEGREKERERNIKARELPHWGLSLQPRHVPWLGIKPAAFVG